VAAQGPRRGEGVRLLTTSIGSPTLAAQIQQFLMTFPAAKWHQWDPLCAGHAGAGARLAFGADTDTQYRIGQADVILSLDSDFLAAGPASLRDARDFAARRRPDELDRMNRLYVVEP